MSEDKDVSPGMNVPVRVERDERLKTKEPFYPILSIDELPQGRETPDQRSRLPYAIQRYLKPEERVIHIQEVAHVWPRKEFDAMEVVQKATKARHANEIGYNGPSVASVNLDETSTEKSRFEDQHGRDDIQTSFDLLELYPKLAETTAITLAESQGVENEPYIEGQPFGQETPGSIILLDKKTDDAIGHKFTDRKHWKYPFYGSADAPVSYINLLSALELRKRGFLNNFYESRKEPGRPEQALSVAFDRSLEWIAATTERYQGLVAYKNPVKGGGIRNQGWRDSDTAMVRENGEWASDEFGIAPIEIQGFLFDAYQNAAVIKRDVYKEYKNAEELQNKAWDLQKFIVENAYASTKDGGFFASGFDWDPNGQIRKLAVATSAMGRLLTSNILKSDNPDVQEMVRQTVRKLLSPEMLTRWGVRTLASNERAYVPFLYHTGPVWMHDTNEVARGLSNHGFYGLDRIVGSTTTHQQRKTGVFYEHISGYDSEEPEVPERNTYVYNQLYDVVYFYEQAPPAGQTWAASTEVAKKHRYNTQPLHAADSSKFKFEKSIWGQLPDHIKQVVTLYEPELALALSS